jgi:hypothetical protein
MGGGLAGYEDSGKVFLWRKLSSVRGRSNPALQELDSSPLLPRTDFGRDSKLSRYGQLFNYRILRRLFGDGLRPTREEIRPLGR